MTDLSDAIEELAAAPKQTAVDGQSVTEHSLAELLEADRYLAEKTARSRSALPLRIQQLKPPGSV